MNQHGGKYLSGKNKHWFKKQVAPYFTSSYTRIHPKAR